MKRVRVLFLLVTILFAVRADAQWVQTNGPGRDWTLSFRTSVPDEIQQSCAEALSGRPCHSADVQELVQGDRDQRRGFVVGGGIASLGYTTNWYYTNAGYYKYDHNPVHKFSRLAIIAILQYQSLLVWGPVDLDLGLDLDIGISGGTKEDWLPFNEQVSSGGGSLGFTLSPRVCFPMEGSGTMKWTPFVSPGIHFQSLGSNGKDIGTQLGDMNSYYTGAEWTENIIGLSIGVGAILDFDRMVVTPEIRFLVAGGGGTDYAPAITPYHWEGNSLENGVSANGASGTFFMLTVGWRL